MAANLATACYLLTQADPFSLPRHALFEVVRGQGGSLDDHGAVGAFGHAQGLRPSTGRAGHLDGHGLPVPIGITPVVEVADIEGRPALATVGASLALAIGGVGHGHVLASRTPSRSRA